MPIIELKKLLAPSALVLIQPIAVSTASAPQCVDAWIWFAKEKVNSVRNRTGRKWRFMGLVNFNTEKMGMDSGSLIDRG